MAFNSLDGIINQITTSNNLTALNHTLRNSLPKEARDTILASELSSGQDPLSVLDMRANTLGVLYIMSARLHTPSSPPPSWHQIHEFCRTFVPEHARYAPDRVTLLAKGIVRLADHINNPKWAIQPLYDLVTRYPPSPAHLTTIHQIFLTSCVTTQNFSSALPLLAHPITAIDTTLSDITYNDNLIYHYTGGIALAALKHWTDAEEYFEICVSSPGQVPAALQLEALKKLVLVQLIAHGKTFPLPKYAHPLLLRIFKSTPYNSFVNAYPRNTEQLRGILEKERPLFTAEKNIGLLTQALERAPRWSIKKLTETYLTLGLADIARAVKIDTEEEVRTIILSMIESTDISAQISASGTVTFSDPVPQFSKADVDRVLKDAQEQGALLGRLEMELERSREYLGKAVKTRDDAGWGPTTEEDVYGALGGSGAWAEDAMFS